MDDCMKVLWKQWDLQRYATLCQVRWLGILCMLLLACPAQSYAGYSPRNAIFDSVTIHDLTVYDGVRQREIPLRIYLPRAADPLPVVLFSHGLGGSRLNNGYLGKYWAERGFVAVFLQHKGSDVEVWENKGKLMAFLSMNMAASRENLKLRVQDVPAVIDQLDAWNQEWGHVLGQKLDLNRIGMSGHSFGARTTQAVSGQQPSRGDDTTQDKRISAALVLSPSVPEWGGKAEALFGQVSLPWLLMTGTRDEAPIGGTDVSERLAVYAALPAGDKYQLVLDGAEHHAFSDHESSSGSKQRNPAHHAIIQAFSTAFWEAYLNQNAQAKAWLTGSEASAMLAPQDDWQYK